MNVLFSKQAHILQQSWLPELLEQQNPYPIAGFRYNPVNSCCIRVWTTGLTFITSNWIKSEVRVLVGRIERSGVHRNADALKI